VVDDSDVIRTVIQDRLRRHGFHNILQAKNAEEAVARFEEHRPGLILLDITMPEVPGTRVAHHILRTDPQAKVIIMTAMSRDKDLVESAIAGGAYGYLRKPVEDHALMELIERLRKEEQAGGAALHPWGKKDPST
jgi:two-component system, chemotaxis family, chemotaxis protein CheY